MSTQFFQAFALCIGVGADLPNTIDDAVGLANILKDGGRCAFPEGQVHVLTSEGATRNHVLTALDTLAQSTTPQSTVLVYFSGHGYRVTTTTGPAYYLMPYGYDVSQLWKTAISGAELTAKLRSIPAQKLLILLDCCHAGGVGEAKVAGLEMAKAPLPPEALTLLAEGKGRVLIASSTETELSYAGKPYSAFTLALIEALCGKGVAKQDGYVRVADLALHTREMVPRRTRDRQHPILHFEQADNFVVAYYAGGDTKPKGLPFAEEPQIEPEPGAWRTMFDQRGQTVHGSQTNIAGDVHGPVFSGQFSGPVAVGGGEAVDLRGSQGAVYKPSGPVEQQFGNRFSITGDGNVVGHNNVVQVVKAEGGSQISGVTQIAGHAPNRPYHSHPVQPVAQPQSSSTTGVSSKRARLEAELAELQAKYATLSRRIAACDKEIGRTQDLVRKQILEEERADWATERDHVAARMTEIETELLGVSSQGAE